MKTTTRKTSYPLTASEKKSARFLMEKMGISKKELKEISSLYGVSFCKIIEIMQLSKYDFVVTSNVPGYCRPDKTSPGDISLSKS